MKISGGIFLVLNPFAAMYRYGRLNKKNGMTAKSFSFVLLPDFSIM